MFLNYIFGGTKHSLDENLSYAGITKKNHFWINFTDIKEFLFCVLIVILLPFVGVIFSISMLFVLICLPLYSLFRFFNFGQKTTL